MYLYMRSSKKKALAYAQGRGLLCAQRLCNVHLASKNS